MSNPVLLNTRCEIIQRAETSLLSRVLGIASLGFLVTAFGVYAAPAYMSGGMVMVSVLASFVLIFGIQATRRNVALSFVLFLGLAFVLGFEISPWMRALIGAGHQDVIFNAAMTTGVGMGVLGIGAQLVSFNYRRVGAIATGALLLLVLAGIVSMFFHFMSPTVYSWAALAIFSVLVITDFRRIRAGGDGQSAVQLAVSIYLDGLNIFLALTRIFSGRRD